MIDVNSKNDFHYATSLTTSAQYILPAWSTSASDANRVRKIRITDIKASVGGTACNVEITGGNGNYKKLDFTWAANSNPNYNWSAPYPLDTVGTSGAVSGIYASASDVGVKIVIDGYVEIFN